MELNPYLVAALPFLMLVSPYIDRFVPAWKPVVLGVVSVAAAAICALFTPEVTAQMAPYQAVELFKSLAAGYTVAKFAEPYSGRLLSSRVGGPTLVALVLVALVWPVMAFAQFEAAPISDKWYWIQQGLSIVYGVFARLWGPKVIAK